MAYHDKPGETAVCASTLKEDRKLLHLLGIINNTIDRNRESINRYRAMNDGLIGGGPEPDGKEAVSGAPNGLVNELIERAEYLHDLCAGFDNQNDRLNQVITDG